MNSWLTDSDLAGLALLVIALAVTAVSAFAEDSSARLRARWLRAWRLVRPGRPGKKAAGRPAPAHISWQHAPGAQPGTRPAGPGPAVPPQRQPGWQSRPAARALVEDRVPGPAALQLEEAVSASDQ